MNSVIEPDFAGKMQKMGPALQQAKANGVHIENEMQGLDTGVADRKELEALKSMICVCRSV